MLMQILSNTPKWVFALFIFLLILGVRQMRDRTMPRRRLVIMPLIFLALSLFGIISAFGWNLEPLLIWAVAYVLMVVFIKQYIPIKDASYDPGTQRFKVPGSIFPLILILIIFCLKYFVGVGTAMQAPFTQDPLFPVIISALYGVSSGIFAGRSLRIMKAANQT